MFGSKPWLRFLSLSQKMKIVLNYEKICFEASGSLLEIKLNYSCFVGWVTFESKEEAKIIQPLKSCPNHIDFFFS